MNENIDDSTKESNTADGDEKDTILTKMRSGDYINLLGVFEEYFGEYIVLETDNEELLQCWGSTK